MKILNIGTDPFSSFWRNAGHQVRVIAKSPLPAHPDNCAVDFFDQPARCAPAIRAIIDEFRPDVIFQGDCSAPVIHCGLEEMDIPKVWYAIDTHLHGAWHPHYAAVFDLVFCAQKNMVTALAGQGRDVEWLPLFCQRIAPFMPWDRREYTAAFVGNLDNQTNPGRVRLFEALNKKVIPGIYIGGGDYVPIYSSSRVVINQSVHDDLNLRFFEAPGCGALLITDLLSHSMDDILAEGADFLTYEHNNVDDLESKIRWALDHPLDAERMARSAQAKIVSGHTAGHRALFAMGRIERLVGNGPLVRVDAAEVFARSAWTHDYCARLRVPQELSVFFETRAHELAVKGRQSLNSRHWALIVLAGRAVADKNYPLARSLLMQIPVLPGDPWFRRRFFALSIEADAFSGTLAEALRTLGMALQEFPEAEEFAALAAAMKKLESNTGV